MKNRVVNACFNDYESEYQVSKRLSEARANLNSFEELLMSKLPKEEATQLMNRLYEATVELESIIQEEYFEAGFNYGKEMNIGLTKVDSIGAL